MQLSRTRRGHLFLVNSIEFLIQYILKIKRGYYITFV